MPCAAVIRGVVHEHVERAERRDRLLHGSATEFRIADVAMNHQHAASEPGDFFAHLEGIALLLVQVDGGLGLSPATPGT